MPAVAVELHSTKLDLARIRVLPRDGHLLVMDRVSGRWVVVAGGYEPLLPLVGAATSDIPVSVRSKVDGLRTLLLDRKVGVRGTERHFDTLNTVILKLTSACNYACAYCYDYEPVERGNRLDPVLAERVLEEAIELCDARLMVILHGGEPMLAWDLVERIVAVGEARARASGKVISFVGQTNLSRLNERVVDFSNEHDIAWGVSLDGPAELNDRWRVTPRGAGTYERFLDALTRFPDFVRQCGVMTTVTAATHDKLLAIARHFRDLGMAGWDWSLFQPIGRGREGARFTFDIDILLASWAELFDAVEAGDFQGFPIGPVKKYLDNFLMGPGGNMCMRGECGAARDLLSISADGTVEACDCIDPSGPMGGLGNANVASLAAARSSGVATAIRSRDVQHLACGDCAWFGVCGGTCMAHAGSVDTVWEAGCALALLAFDRISHSIVRSGALRSWWDSLPR
jgi:uncharacterized protein